MSRLAVLALLAAALSTSVIAQPTSPLYDTVRDAGASPSDAFSLMAAMRSVLPIQESKLVAADTSSYLTFGISVSLSGDRALIGAPYDNTRGFNNGSAYVFVRSGNVWTQEAKLTLADSSDYAYFGWSVALSNDRAVIGAIGQRAAYVFVRSGGTWVQEDELVAANDTDGFRFGWSVALSGNRVLVSARPDESGGGIGSAYVFVRTEDRWVKESRLTADAEAVNDGFGYAVSLSDDRALIGASGGRSPRGVQGSAYVFVRAGSTWTRETRLVAVDGTADDLFGCSVSLSDDRALVGARFDDDRGINSGAAYVFARSGTVWTEEAKLTADDGAEYEGFGIAVSLSDDHALVGVAYNDDSGSESGSAYAFGRTGSTWVQEAKIIAADNAAYDRFGISVSISDTRVLIGAYGDDDGGTQSGSAYIFAGIGTVAAEGGTSSGISLSAPVPNPAAARSMLTLTVDAPQLVRAAVYDALGRQVAVAFEGVVGEAAHIEVRTGGLTPGVYVVRVVGTTFAETRRLTVVR